MGGYAFHSNNVATFFQPARPWVAWAGCTGFMMLQNAITNVRAFAALRACVLGLSLLSLR